MLVKSRSNLNFRRNYHNFLGNKIDPYFEKWKIIVLNSIKLLHKSPNYIDLEKTNNTVSVILTKIGILNNIILKRKRDCLNFVFKYNDVIHENFTKRKKFYNVICSST